MSAEHGYTALSRAREETHLWLADSASPVGDCTNHTDPLLEDRIDTLAYRLSTSRLMAPAADQDTMMLTTSDQQLIPLRDDLAQVLRDGPIRRDPSPELAALDTAISDARTVAMRVGTGDQQIVYLESRRQDLLAEITARADWIEENADLIHRYTAIVKEVDRRVHARTLLYRLDPPDEVLAALGPRASSAEPQRWDVAVEVYTRARLHAGPDADLMDPTNHQAGPWRDVVYAASPVEHPMPVLRRAG